MPYGKYARILESIRLAHATGEPEIGIILSLIHIFVANLSFKNAKIRDYFLNLQAMPLKLTTYYRGSKVPDLPGTNTFHSTVICSEFEGQLRGIRCV